MITLFFILSTFLKTVQTQGGWIIIFIPLFSQLWCVILVEVHEEKFNLIQKCMNIHLWCYTKFWQVVVSLRSVAQGIYIHTNELFILYYIKIYWPILFSEWIPSPFVILWHYNHLGILVQWVMQEKQFWYIYLWNIKKDLPIISSTKAKYLESVKIVEVGACFPKF